MRNYVPIPPASPGDIERFLSFVDKQPDGCWQWTGCIGGNGAGRAYFSLGARSLSASRVAWAIANGSSPTLDVCHSCDNPSCVNPSHLWLGTHIENMRDMKAKGRASAGGKKALTHCKRGHPLSGDNLWLRWNGHRSCKTCNSIRQNRRNEIGRALGFVKRDKFSTRGFDSESHLARYVCRQRAKGAVPYPLLDLKALGNGRFEVSQ